MKTSIRVYLENAELAGKNEQTGDFKAAADQWRTAWRVANCNNHKNWSYCRAEHCFKRAVDEKQIAIKRSRKYDFDRFMEANND